MAGPALAQDPAQDPPLVVPFASFPPFMHLDETGARIGFSVELAELIGAEIGVKIAYLDVANTEELIAAQASGAAQLIPGILALPPLRDTNVFSTEVASDVLRPAVLERNAAAFEAGDLAGFRIGIVPLAQGSNEPILEQNTPFPFDGPQAALMDLLSGRIDAVLLPPPVVYRIAKDAGLDGRIRFVGAPLREASRHVALHESRSELLAPINAAIAALEADGRLSALRLRHDLTVPAPPPKVLTAGIASFAPFQTADAEGNFGGFAVESLRDIADRAGLDIQFRKITAAEWQEGPRAGAFDIVFAPEVVSWPGVDFTNAVYRIGYHLVVPGGSDAASLDDLGGATLGISAYVRSNDLLATRDGIDFRVLQTPADVIFALGRGEVDAIVAPGDLTARLSRETGFADAIRVLDPPVFFVDRALALRPGLGAIRDRLNAVIPGYLISPEYIALRDRYFAEPVFWTQPRIYAVNAIAATVLLAWGLSAAWRWQRQRRLKLELAERELAREHAHAAELEGLVADLERSNRELDEFAYIASHDLREPLRGVAINATFLGREELSDKGRQRVDRMIALTQRMERLISDLLFFSQLGRGGVASEKVEPEKIVADIREELSEWLAEQGAEIAVAGDLPAVYADRSKVKTVFQNLITNGLKYNSAPKKRVEIGFAALAEADGSPLRNVFYVSDNGIGIAEEDRDAVFQIFKRLNLDEEYGTGTGAGLSFVRKIVEDCGGQIALASKENAGTTFFLSLPRSPQDR